MLNPDVEMLTKVKDVVLKSFSSLHITQWPLHCGQGAATTKLLPKLLRVDSQQTLLKSVIAWRLMSNVTTGPRLARRIE